MVSIELPHILGGREECKPSTIRESVARVKEAFLPTGKVAPSMWPSSSVTWVGSTNGSLSTIDMGVQHAVVVEDEWMLTLQ